jgi:hypothetical protein
MGLQLRQTQLTSFFSPTKAGLSTPSDTLYRQLSDIEPVGLRGCWQQFWVALSRYPEDPGMIAVTCVFSSTEEWQQFALALRRLFYDRSACCSTWVSRNARQRGLRTVVFLMASASFRRPRGFSQSGFLVRSAFLDSGRDDIDRRIVELVPYLEYGAWLSRRRELFASAFDLVSFGLDFGSTAVLLQDAGLVQLLRATYDDVDSDVEEDSCLSYGRDVLPGGIVALEDVPTFESR